MFNIFGPRPSNSTRKREETIKYNAFKQKLKDEKINVLSKADRKRLFQKNSSTFGHMTISKCSEIIQELKMKQLQQNNTNQKESILSNVKQHEEDDEDEEDDNMVSLGDTKDELVTTIFTNPLNSYSHERNSSYYQSKSQSQSQTEIPTIETTFSENDDSSNKGNKNKNKNKNKNNKNNKNKNNNNNNNNDDNNDEDDNDDDIILDEKELSSSPIPPPLLPSLSPVLSSNKPNESNLFKLQEKLLCGSQRHKHVPKQYTNVYENPINMEKSKKAAAKKRTKQNSMQQTQQKKTTRRN